MAGYDTASFVQDVYQAADSTYGAPGYWLRYFSPSPNTPVNSSSSNANAECRAVWDSGAKHLGPITSPAQSRLSSNSSSEGHADAQTTASALYNTWLEVGPLLLPSNGVLYTWLDQEASTSLSLGYWNGWGNFINGYNWPGNGFPLFASLYCNPCAAPPNCSTIGNANAAVCFAVWSSEPQKCGFSVRNPPPYAPETCSGCAGVNVASKLWQFAEKGACGLSVNVDMDVSNISAGYASNCFNVSSRP